MVTMAREYGRAPCPAERLADGDNIPGDYVSQILVKLRRGGLVVSRRGSTGGYVLSRRPDEITLGQVVRALDGDIFEDVCEKYDGGRKDCRHQEHCSISPVWRRLGDLVTGYLESVTLASILAQKSGSCGSVPAWIDKISSGK